MEITALRDGDVTILAISGALDTLHAPALSARAHALCDAGTCRVLIDLAQAPYMTSAGFRSFIEISRRTRQAGGEMALCGLNDLLRDLFEVSGFEGIFRIYPERASALAAMAGQGAQATGLAAPKQAGEA
jgi:anti-sigma B factor antagonist